MAGPTDGTRNERSLEELVQTASAEAVALARQEAELARRELAVKVKQAAPGAAMVGGAALLGALAAGTGTAALVLMLARRPGLWAASLGVTGLYAGAGVVLAREGIARMRAAGPPVPEATVKSVKENLGWMKRRARFART
jgi:Putative Actinobacterial Holin-X, holin superfamily III